MDTENYISPNKITKKYDITSGTLRRWSEAGKIRCLRPNGGKRIYNIEDINKMFNSNEKPVEVKKEDDNTLDNGSLDQYNKSLESAMEKLNVLLKSSRLSSSVETELNKVNLAVADMKLKMMQELDN